MDTVWDKGSIVSTRTFQNKWNDNLWGERINMHNTVSVSPQRRSPSKDPILRGALEDRPDSTQLNKHAGESCFWCIQTLLLLCRLTWSHVPNPRVENRFIDCHVNIVAAMFRKTAILSNATIHVHKCFTTSTVCEWKTHKASIKCMYRPRGGTHPGQVARLTQTHSHLHTV